MIDVTSDRARVLVESALALPESRTLEVKRVSGKMVQKALETICAFANTEGGVLALGVEDPERARGVARLFGVEENPEALDELRRKVQTQFNPPIDSPRFFRVPCTLRQGEAGHIVLLHVGKSEKVHSIVGDGTWTRLDASNREMTAAEITDLAYQRGVKSAETLSVAIDLSLLDTPAWRSYCATRGLDNPDLATRLPRLGLAHVTSTAAVPHVAAVLLFAEEPAALLAAQGMRADIRVFHYKGKTIQRDRFPICG